MNTPERHTVYARDGLRRIWDRLSAPELAMMIAAGGESVIPRITHRAERIAEARRAYRTFTKAAVSGAEPGEGT